ncbi:MAG: acyltransferase [Deltaproteobacteria bacterium SG8_13]|nr:MAG: acyltransferase [Deltaproteobacteria bacterium SG8_13]
MKKRLHGPILGVVTIIACLLNTAICSVPILLIAALKAVIPANRWRRMCTRILNFLAGCWVAFNKALQRFLLRIKWEVNGLENLPRSGWYLVLANHQSWVDIVVLQNIFHRRIPFLKFFLKKELFWYPVLGLCWWALDFPFIKRYSPKFLAKNPHLKGKDIETTLKACKKFSELPVSVMNFVEGTRFTKEKHAALKSPYANLLRPRAAGIALVISGLSDKLQRILDVTIVYPGQERGFWPFVCGEIREIKVHINALPVTDDLIGDYGVDRKFRVQFHRWLNRLWLEKDRRIERMLGRADVDLEQFIPAAKQQVAEAVEG